MNSLNEGSSCKSQEELIAELDAAQKQIFSCRKRVAELREELAQARIKLKHYASFLPTVVA